MAQRWITKNGKPVLINTDGPGKGIAVAAATGMIVAVGGFSGGALSGAAPGATGGSTASVRTVRAGKAEAKRTARTRDADHAWRRIGMRRLKQTKNRPSLGCVKASFGEVQEFLIRRPCTSLDRMLFAIADRRGDTVLVSVSWVKFRTADRRNDFKRLIDVYGTGDFKPLGASLLRLAEVRFTGRYYHSIAGSGGRLTVAETEAVKGTVHPEVLDTVAQVAAELPGPPRRRH